MTENPDVVVIGGGVIGVCSAYYLRRAGLSVTLLERDAVCSGSSYGNSGLIVPSHSVPLPMPGVVGRAIKWMFDPESPFYIKPRLDPKLISWLWQFRANSTHERMRKSMKALLKLSIASRALYDGLVSDEEIDCNFHANGLFMLYATEEGHREGIEEGEMMAEEGLEVLPMDASGVREMEPAVREDIVGGVYYPGDAHLSPADFVTGLAAKIQQHGVDVRENSEVVGLEVEDRRIDAVRTREAEYRPGTVVLAAGSWSPVVTRNLRFNLPVQPAKGYSVTFDWQGAPLTRPPYPGRAEGRGQSNGLDDQVGRHARDGRVGPLHQPPPSQRDHRRSRQVH